MRKVSLILIFVLATCYINIAKGNWFEKVVNTVNTINTIVNGPQMSKRIVKISIPQLLEFNNQYINAIIKTEGRVVGLAVADNGYNKYFVMILEDGGSKIKVELKRRPLCYLLDRVRVIGVFNGNMISNATIEY